MQTSYNKIDSEHQQVLNAIISGRNVFLSGEAGTDKSVVIREFEKHCSKQLVRLAPTGIAAQSIEGSTIHCFLKFNTRVQDPQQPHELPMNQYLLLRTMEVLLIDEISMVRSDIFTAMDTVLREVSNFLGANIGNSNYLPQSNLKNLCLKNIIKKQKNILLNLKLKTI